MNDTGVLPFTMTKRNPFPPLYAMFHRTSLVDGGRQAFTKIVGVESDAPTGIALPLHIGLVCPTCVACLVTFDGRENALPVRLRGVIYLHGYPRGLGILRQMGAP